MTAAQFTQLVRYYTKTNSTTFTDAELLLLANTYIDDFATEIIKADEDYFGSPETANLVADQREYPFPSDLLNRFEHIEAKLDGTNWITLEELDLRTYARTTDEATIIANYANAQGRAKYDIYRNALWIYSGTITDVTNGIKLWGYQWPAHLTDLTDTTDMSVDPSTTGSGFPRAFHELLARRVSIAYKSGLDKPRSLNDNELKFDVDFRSKIDSITEMNMQREFTASIPKEEQWDNGYNL